VVGLQAAQGLVELGDDRAPAGTAAVRVAGEHVPEELRRQNHVLAATGARGEEVAEDLLRVAVGVEVRGVDEVPAAVQVGREDLLRLLHAAAGAAGILPEGHRAEGERADAEAGTAEGDVVVERHGSMQTRGAWRR
jgi:hypothetical protein